MFGKVRIRKYERGLWFRDGDFHRLLDPGTHRLWGRLLAPMRNRVEVVNTRDTRLEHELGDVLVDEPALQSQLVVVDLKDNQRAFVWKDGRLEYILGSGRHAFWKTPAKLEVETYDVDEFEFEHARVDAIRAHPEGSRYLAGVDVDAHEEVLLFRDGRPPDSLGPGRHMHWKDAGRVTIKPIDKREQIADVAGQEIMTKDKVTLRVNLLVTYGIVDALLAVTAVADYAQSLYREAQLSLRAAVGTRLLDELLTDKESIGKEVADALADRVHAFGLAIRSVGLRDIILPGDMKAILNQVIEAEKQAQANLIRRREETAAARSQANTAKLLAENPTLARMKEMETLADVLAGTRSTFVFGTGQLTEQVKSLIGGQLT